jgi:hypothetical protein
MVGYAFYTIPAEPKFVKILRSTGIDSLEKRMRNELSAFYLVIQVVLLVPVLFIE